MLTIDGSMGEGGGQILRTSLSLAMITQTEFAMTNIRANRRPPGLKAQHVEAVRLAARIVNANVEGAELGSQRIFFSPGQIRAGAYNQKIKTAGAVSLLLQTAALPLSLTGLSSRLILAGGTSVPASPDYYYLDAIWRPMLEQIGITLSLKLDRAGFYPVGGGQISCRVSPAAEINALNLVERGNLVRIFGIAAIAGLDSSIATRIKHQVLRRLEPIHRATKIRTVRLDAFSPGVLIFLAAEYEHATLGYTVLGAKGIRAEAVADQAVDLVLYAHQSKGAVDEYLADQILLPLSLAQDESNFSVVKITNHLTTNADVIKRFLPVKIKITDHETSFLVTINPGNFRSTPVMQSSK
jgi:RNA 3'-phosphate cyclase